MRNTHATISLGNLTNNFKAIQKRVGEKVKVCAIVKADAYGHGQVPVAQALEKSGVDYLAVAIVEEGITLRNAGIIAPILVMGPIAEQDMSICIQNNLTITVPSQTKLESIKKAAQTLKTQAIIHLKVDTGMGRIGVHWDRAEPLLSDALKYQKEGWVTCEGIYSHFSNSLDPEFTEKQFNRFRQILDQAQQIGLSIPIQHICSSRSIMMYPKYHLGMVRPGIILYGIEPETDKKILSEEFKPVLAWKTTVAYFKAVEHGEFVGYGGTWTPAEDYARIVTLPVGYADGYPRRLSNKGSVLIHGIKYPIAGRVCMDQVMISLGTTGEAYLGDEVILIGKQGDETISVEDIAKILETAPHEITTTISARVPRIYID